MKLMTRLSILTASVVALSGGLAAAQSPATAASVDPAKRAAIFRIMELTNAADQVIRTMEAGMPAQRAANPQIPAAFWDRFMKRAKEKRGDFLESLVPVYDRYFSLSDLNEIARFYESPIGKRLLVAMPQLLQESMMEGQKWGFRIGQEIGEEMARDGSATRQ